MAIEVICEEDSILKPLEVTEHEFQAKVMIANMLAVAKELIVNEDCGYRKITSLYRQARDWKKSIEIKRKELTEPLRSQTVKINDHAKKLTDPLDIIIDVANAKANAYQRHLEEVKRLEDEKLKAAASIFDAQDEIYIAPMEKIIRGDGAIAVTKTEKKFRLVDITKVPEKYLMVDEKAINQALKMGINEIPGVEIYEETTTQLRVR